MSTTQQSLKPLDLNHHSKHETQKLASLENSLADLTRQFVNKDIDTIEAETIKIQSFAQGITKVVEKLSTYKQQCTNTIADLQKEVNDLNGKIKIYERDFKTNNKETQYKKQIEINQKNYLAEWQKRITIAQKIDTDSLAKVQIEDRKSKANQIFKWVIVAIYGEPQTKFYWPNFKEQIFERDQGADFKERMGKINASNAREQQRVKTVDFLKSYKQIIECKQLKKVNQQCEDIRKVAEIFLNCLQISKTIKNLESLIEKSRQQSRERDEQAMRWKARVEALQDRIKSNRQYLIVLNRIQTLLAGKLQNYTEKETMAKDIVNRLKENGDIGHLDIDVGDQKRDHCQCTIF